MHRTVSFTASGALLVIVLLMAAAASAQKRPPRELTVSTGEGRAGLYRVGQRAVPEPDGMNFVVEDERVIEIQVTSPRFFTERGVRVRTSTITEFIRAYGAPQSSRREGNEMVLIYPGFRARFPWISDARRRREVRLVRLDLVARPN